MTSGGTTRAPSASERPAKLTVAQSLLSVSTVLRPSPLRSNDTPVFNSPLLFQSMAVDPQTPAASLSEVSFSEMRVPRE